MTVLPDIQTLFDRYLAAWNARDFAGVAACYAEPALFVLPSATVPIPDRPAMVGLLQNIFAGLEVQGFSHTEIGSISAQACGADLAIVDARDIRRLRKDGTTLETIDAHYTARKIDGAWYFVSAVTCTPGWQSQ